MAFKYLDIEEALALHATVLGLTTGSLGVRDMNSLLGCLERPKTTIGGREMFTSVFDKAAAIIETIARNHVFIDGNKRTAHLLGAYFLSTNGYALAPKKGEIETFMLWVVTEKPSIPEIAAWLEERSMKIDK